MSESYYYAILHCCAECGVVVWIEDRTSTRAESNRRVKDTLCESHRELGGPTRNGTGKGRR